MAKQFLAILTVTALVWLVVSMSEISEYPCTVKVEYEVYDDVRYSLLQADTALLLQIQCSGYDALLRSLNNETPTLKVKMPGSGLHRSIAVASLSGVIQTQLGSGIVKYSSQKDSLRIVLAARSHRTFRPQLDDVKFTFAEQCGLYGEPVISPAEIVLYGPEELLDKIPEVRAKKTQIDNISESSTIELELDPVWRSLGDVKASNTKINVYLPVENYVEREFRIPVQVEGADTNVRIRIYPENVTVRAWVPASDLARSPDLKVVVNYSDVLAENNSVRLRLVEYSSYLRPHSIEPNEVQCIVIK